jgi:3-deoxy-manno-octulosonate cytidylyltransferase (CMP-KDO synthetase)
MKTLIVVPARYESSRFPGKPLIQLTGADGKTKSLIQRSWEAAIAVKNVDVIVATDDDRIKVVAEGFGAKVVMTSQKCANGTERCADAIANIDIKYDLIVNLQGDAPLSPAWFVQDLIDSFENNLITDMATPVLRCDSDTILAFKSDRAAGRVGGTTAVFDHNNKALYFSKEVLPYSNKIDAPIYHHVGIYAYRPESLAKYITWEEGPLEAEEGLEQLRFLENGCHIQCVEVNGKGRAFWEVNNPSDIPRVNMMLQKLKIS